MSAQDNYGIRPDYVPHAANATMPRDDGSASAYWSSRMIRMANHYQYHVYRCGGELARQHGLKSALDIGCGPAFKLAEFVAPVCDRLVGLDEPGIVQYCRAHFKVGQFLAYNIEIDSFPLDEKFDLVISADVIEHLTDPDKLLDGIRRAATPESYIVISTPERDILRGAECLISPKAAHVREWNFDELERYLTSRGFRVLEHRLVPPMRFNLSKEFFRQWYGQFRAGRPMESCQMAVCRVE